MIEVLVSILILSLGMLAMAGLHASSLRYGKMAQFRSVATQLAYDLSDRMRANTVAAVAGAYNFAQDYDSSAFTEDPPACADPAKCTSAEMAAIDLAQWRKSASSSLPGGSLYVSQDAATPNMMNIWVLWLDPQLAADNTLGGQCPAALGDEIPAQCSYVRVAL